jgi:hypothetical protein
MGDVIHPIAFKLTYINCFLHLFSDIAVNNKKLNGVAFLLIAEISYFECPRQNDDSQVGTDVTRAISRFTVQQASLPVYPESICPVFTQMVQPPRLNGRWWL